MGPCCLSSEAGGSPGPWWRGSSEGLGPEGGRCDAGRELACSARRPLRRWGGQRMATGAQGPRKLQRPWSRPRDPIHRARGPVSSRTGGPCRPEGHSGSGGGACTLVLNCNKGFKIQLQLFVLVLGSPGLSSRVLPHSGPILPPQGCSPSRPPSQHKGRLPCLALPRTPAIRASPVLPGTPVHSAWTPGPSRSLGDIVHPTPLRARCVPGRGKPLEGLQKPALTPIPHFTTGTCGQCLLAAPGDGQADPHLSPHSGSGGCPALGTLKRHVLAVPLRWGHCLKDGPPPHISPPTPPRPAGPASLYRRRQGICLVIREINNLNFGLLPFPPEGGPPPRPSGIPPGGAISLGVLAAGRGHPARPANRISLWR